MENINNLLQKFKKLTPPDNFIRESFSKALKELLKIEVEVEDISFNNKTGVVFLNIDNFKKTTIFLKKTKLIKICNNFINKDIIKDIR